MRSPRLAFLKLSPAILGGAIQNGGRDVGLKTRNKKREQLFENSQNFQGSLAKTIKKREKCFRISGLHIFHW